MSQSESSPVVVTQFYSKCTFTEHSNTNIRPRFLKQKSLPVSSTSIESRTTPSALHTKSGYGNNRVMSPKDCEKSSSKMCQSDATSQKVKTARKSSETIQSSSVSNPVSRQEKEETKKSLFPFYLGESSSSCCSKGSATNKTSDPTVVDKTELRRLSSAQEKSSRKGRFKKILHPLRRSQSAGNTKDVPAHALFLRHIDTEMDPPRRKSQVSAGESLLLVTS